MIGFMRQEAHCRYLGCYYDYSCIKTENYLGCAILTHWLRITVRSKVCYTETCMKPGLGLVVLHRVASDRLLFSGGCTCVTLCLLKVFIYSAKEICWSVCMRNVFVKQPFYTPQDIYVIHVIIDDNPHDSIIILLIIIIKRKILFNVIRLKIKSCQCYLTVILNAALNSAINFGICSRRHFLQADTF